MKIHTLMSSLALVSAMTFSGAAFAQAMIGDVAIPDTNLGAFQEKCAAIASASTQTLAEPGDDPTETGSVAAGDAATDNPDLASKENIDMLLASLTPEQCKEAGLLPGGANAVAP